MKKYTINNPIRVAEVEDSLYEILITREFTTLEVNKAVIDLIHLLNSKKIFTIEDVNSYLIEQNIINANEYQLLYNFLIDNKLFIEI